MKKLLLGLSALLLFAHMNPAVATESVSGLDVPRMVSIRSNQVNARSGPGYRYPIEWVYLQKDSPVEIIAEFEIWRKIKDWDGSESWVNKSLLSGKRTVKITTSGENKIYSKADYDSKVIGKAEDGVVGQVKKCPKKSDFCLIKFSTIEGWVAKNNIFGVYSDEVID